jgi:hypothetical protein
VGSQAAVALRLRDVIVERLQDLKMADDRGATLLPTSTFHLGVPGGAPPGMAPLIRLLLLSLRDG